MYIRRGERLHTAGVHATSCRRTSLQEHLLTPVPPAWLDNDYSSILPICELHLAFILANVLRRPNSGQKGRIATGNTLDCGGGTTELRFLLDMEMDAKQCWRPSIGCTNGRRDVAK
jgi:hypothetical protein